MSDETTATPTPEAEPAPQSTPPGQEAKAGEVSTPATPTAEAVRKTPLKYELETEPAWKAYIAAQATIGKLHQRVEGLSEQNKGLVTAIDSMKQDQREILKATGGEDAVRQSQAREAQGIAQEAARRAANAAQQLIGAQVEILTAALEAAGVPTNNSGIDWGGNEPDVETWKAHVLPQVQARIVKANEDRARSVTAKSNAEIKAEAEALAQRQLKEAGVDRIDTAKGSGSTGSYVDRVKNLKYGTPEYEEWKLGVMSGRTQVK